MKSLGNRVLAYLAQPVHAGLVPILSLRDWIFFINLLGEF